MPTMFAATSAMSTTLRFGGAALGLVAPAGAAAAAWSAIGDPFGADQSSRCATQKSAQLLA
jgi:hypothetical protein